MQIKIALLVKLINPDGLAIVVNKGRRYIYCPKFLYKREQNNLKEKSELFKVTMISFDKSKLQNIRKHGDLQINDPRKAGK